MIWLIQFKVDSTERTDGASSVRVSSGSALFESVQRHMAHLGERAC